MENNLNSKQMTKEDFTNGVFTDIEVLWPDFSNTFSVAFTKNLEVIQQYQTGLTFEEAFDLQEKLCEYFGIIYE